MRTRAVSISGAKRSRRQVTRAGVGQRLDDRPHVVGAALAFGHGIAQRRLVGRLAGLRRPLEVGEEALGAARCPCLVGGDDVDDAVGGLHLDRADLVGVDPAEPATLDHRRAAHAQRDVLGGDDQVGAAGDHGVAGEAAAGDHRDPWHQAGEPRPEREGARVEGGDDGIVGVARPTAATLGEEDDGEAQALDQLEEPVLLAVSEGALRAGQHRVVVGEHSARRGLAEEVAVDTGRAGEQAVGRGAGDQVVDLAPAALGGDREAPVLDEGAGVDELVEVLPGRAPTGRVAALEGVGTGLVAGEGAPRQHLGEVRALLVVPLRVGHPAGMFPAFFATCRPVPLLAGTGRAR